MQKVELEEFRADQQTEFVLGFIERAFRCTNKADLHDLIEGLKELIPFTVWNCTLTVFDGEIKSCLNVNCYPKPWAEEYLANRYCDIDPTVLKHFSKTHLGKYQYWDDTFEESQQTEGELGAKQVKFIKRLRSYDDLQHGISIGCQNSLIQDEGLIFSIAGPDLPHSNRIVAILSSVIYYILVAFDNAHALKQGRILTRQEARCLDRAQRGESNGEIAEFLGIKSSTVKTHLDNVFRKLEASNRANAVAIALSKKLIHPL